MEQFKELEEFPGYKIGNQGTIIGKRFNTPLKPTLGKRGYFTVNLYFQSKTVHSLVAKAWILNSENKPCIDHIDRNKLNNCITNLKWVTYMENNNNISMLNTNTSGITGLNHNFINNCWEVKRTRFGKKYYKNFKERKDAEEFLKTII